MTEVRVGDQTIRLDRAATAAAYETIGRGFAEECGCLHCKNFIAQRDVVYPPSFRALLEELGVDPNKEGEAFHCGLVEDGCHLYGGWFSFVGEIVKWGEQNTIAPDAHQFEYFFTTVGPNPPAFRDGPRLTLEFSNHVKWVLSETA